MILATQTALILTFTLTIVPCFSFEISQIRKCCKFDEILDSNGTCVSHGNGDKWSIPQEYFHSLQDLALIEFGYDFHCELSNINNLLYFRIGRPQCNDSISKRVNRRKLVEGDIHLLSGNLAAFLESPGQDEFNASRVLVHESEFCIDIL